MVSNPGGAGLLGSVERCFELCWGHVTAVAVQPVLVEPVHPVQGRELELVDVVPAGRVGAVGALGLVEPVGGLRERVVVGIGDGPDRWSGADLVEPFGEPHGGELRAGVGVGDQPDKPSAAAGASGHLERVEDHVGAHVRRHTPAGNAQFSHQTGGLVPADLMTGTDRRTPKLVGAVDLAVQHPQDHEDLHHRGVTQRPRAPCVAGAPTAPPEPSRPRSTGAWSASPASNPSA